MQVISVFRCIVFWGGFCDSVRCRSDSIASTGGQLENFEDFSPVSVFFWPKRSLGNGTKVIDYFLAFLDSDRKSAGFF
jgi:hypothetical protein